MREEEGMEEEVEEFMIETSTTAVKYIGIMEGDIVSMFDDVF